MRIISGRFKGRRLTPPANIKARPTTDMAREALFNVLQNELEIHGADVLDLFSGTGAISLEFISRGANSATAIDVEHLSKRFLDEIKKEWKIDNLKTVKADIFKLLKKADRSFDIVFADPPYADPRFPELPDMIFDSGWVKQDGLLILEHGPEHNFQFNPRFQSHRQYSSVNFSFFRN